MPRYQLMWFPLAEQYYRSLPAEIRSLVADRIEQLLDDPTWARRAVYDSTEDEWSVPVANGLLVYVVTESPHARVFVARLVGLI